MADGLMTPSPTAQAETGLTAIVQDHFGEALSEPRGDSCSHAAAYAGGRARLPCSPPLQHRNPSSILPPDKEIKISISLG